MSRGGQGCNIHTLLSRGLLFYPQARKTQGRGSQERQGRGKVNWLHICASGMVSGNSHMSQFSSPRTRSFTYFFDQLTNISGQPAIYFQGSRNGGQTSYGPSPKSSWCRGETLMPRALL